MMGTDDLENMVMELATDLEPGSWTRVSWTLAPAEILRNQMAFQSLLSVLQSDDLSSEEKIQRSADIMKNTPEMYHRIKREETERTCSSISRH
ncbi:Hypothetical predicted protein [Cloeon dipterum]|uniref:Uncharacterized protein n=1 Tax=Cloeon dipterum TaxID=197152 RepID=A0A8S1BPU9_9INSE|nr:Hypothetical predicted protein [Cloeon dipterum]